MPSAPEPRRRAMLLGAGVLVVLLAAVAVLVGVHYLRTRDTGDASPAGLFPRQAPEEAGFMHGWHTGLVKAAASRPTTSHFQVTMPAVKGDWALEARCDTGNITVRINGGNSLRRPCGDPEVHGLLAAFIRAHKSTFKVSVDQPQRSAWGMALYVDAGPTHANEVTPGEREAKASPQS